MSGWKGKTRGGLLGHRIFIFGIKYFGLGGAYLMLRIVAFYYLLFSRKSNKHIHFYFRKILHYSKSKSILSIYRNYYVFGQVLVDKVAVLAGFSNKFTYDFEGEEYLRDMKNGGLLISAHVGNWEVAGNLLQRLDTCFNIVMFDEEHEKIKHYLEEVMTKKHVKVILLRNDLSHLIEIRNALQNKELVAIHGDRFVEGSKSLVCNFLGWQAHFPEGPFYLAAKFNAPVSFVFAMKESKTHYHFYATPARVYETTGQRRIDSKALRPILSDYARQLEKIIRKYPLQWFNYYQFWEKW